MVAFVFTPALIAGIAQAGFGAFQYFKAKEKKKAADLKAQGMVKRMRDELQKLTNPYGALQVSDRKEELIKEAGLQTGANVTQALQEAGAGAVQGGASSIVRAETDRNLQLMAGLDEKEKAAAFKRAEGEQWRQEMTASGEMGILKEQLQGVQAEKLFQGQAQQMGLAGITSGVGNIGKGIIKGSNLYPGGGTKSATETAKEVGASAAAAATAAAARAKETSYLRPGRQGIGEFEDIYGRGDVDAYGNRQYPGLQTYS